MSTDHVTHNHEKASVNPCSQHEAAFGAASLSMDAYVLNPHEHECTQVCIPEAFRMVGRMHGVSFGHDCMHLGYDDLTKTGTDHGVHFYTFR